MVIGWMPRACFRRWFDSSLRPIRVGFLHSERLSTRWLTILCFIGTEVRMDCSEPKAPFVCVLSGLLNVWLAAEMYIKRVFSLKRCWDTQIILVCLRKNWVRQASTWATSL